MLFPQGDYTPEPRVVGLNLCLWFNLRDYAGGLVKPVSVGYVALPWQGDYKFVRVKKWFVSLQSLKSMIN